VEVINLLFEEFRVFQKLEVYEWFCIRGGIIDPDTTSYLLFCVMVSCFAGYVMTRGTRRKGWEGRNRRHLGGAHMLARIVVDIRAADIAVELEPQL
jgi:hypothetical protein